MNSNIKQAVILAAGKGTRMKGFIGDIPKGFIKIDHKTLIERSVDTLLSYGIEKIVIVTGYLSEFYDGLKDKYPEIITVKNEKFSDSGSMYSLFEARNSIDGDFILLESDLVYERRAIDALMRTNKENAILISGATNSQDEVYVGVQNSMVNHITKDKSQVENIGGELVGISKISLEMYKKMLELVTPMFEESLHQEYEAEGISHLAKYYPVHTYLIEDLAWAEIDNEELFNRALNDVYPKVVENDKHYLGVVKRNVLLNPGPATTTDSVKHAMICEDICPREKDFGDLVWGVRKDLARVVKGGDDYTTIMFSGSGTMGVEAVVCSAIPEGKKIFVISNGAYGTRMANIARTYKIDVIEYAITYGDYPDINVVEKYLKDNPDISHVGVIHHETTTGMLNPVKEISEVAHKHGAEMIVDAMSSYAGKVIDVNEMKIEYLTSSSNKCIQGMAGISLVVCKKSSLEALGDVRRCFGLDLKHQHEYFERTRQMQFTPPVQMFYALRQALDEFFEETAEGRADRYEDNWNTLYNGLKEMGFKFLLPFEQESKLLLAICDPEDKNYDFNKMHDYLYDRGFTIYPGKGAKKSTFRLAVIGDLTPRDIKDFLVELKNYLKDENITKF